jgi:protein phosphatase
MNTNIDLRAPASSRRRPSCSLQLSACGATAQGQRRDTNQDRFLAAALAEHDMLGSAEILAVADGAGGSLGGGIASALAIESIENISLPELRRRCAQPSLDHGSLAGEVRAIFQRADAYLTDAVSRSFEYLGVATTLTVAISFRGRLFVAYAGDSRAYLLHDGWLRQLTHDHTVAAELMRRGLLAPDIAERRAYQSVLTSYLGGKVKRLRVETCEADLAPGDVVLVCTDGLTDTLPELEIATILRAEGSPGAASARLIARAVELGAQDDVTAVVARCEPVW